MRPEKITLPLEIISEHKYINLISILTYVRKNSWKYTFLLWQNNAYSNRDMNKYPLVKNNLLLNFTPLPHTIKIAEFHLKEKKPTCISKTQHAIPLKQQN